MQKNGLLIIVLVLVLLGAGIFFMTGKSDPAGEAATGEAMSSLTEAPVTVIDVAEEQEITDDTLDTAATSTEATPSETAEQAPENETAVATETATAPATEETSPAPEEEPATAAVKAEDSGSLLAAPKSLQIDVAAAMADRPIGSENAPVTIIEYASMTCPHCAHFANNTLPEIKKLLIETGKARLIFRDFPLDSFALKAAMLARCADASIYTDLIEVIFKNQERWIKSEDPVAALKQYGALAGMDEEYMNACVNSEELRAAILHSVQEAQQKYDIKSTPTFIFNYGAEKFNGGREAKAFVDTVEKLSKAK